MDTFDHILSSRNIIMNDLNFAIKMENDGEKYYREQAEINKNNAIII